MADAAWTMLAVFETQARLEGLRQARTELAATGTTAKKTGSDVKEMSATSSAAFAAMTDAQKKAYQEFITGSKQMADAVAGTGGTGGATPAVVALGKGAAETSKKIQPLPTQLRTAANAATALSFAAAAGKGSMAAMATQAGGLAMSLSMVTRNATLAAGAAGLGALVTVVVTLIGLMSQLSKVSDEAAKRTTRITSGMDEAGLEAMLARAKLATAQATTGAAGSKPISLEEMQKGTPEQRAQAVAIENERIIFEQLLSVRRDNRKREREERKREGEQAIEEAKRDAEQLADARRKATVDSEERIISMTAAAQISRTRAGGNEEEAELQTAAEQTAERLRALARDELLTERQKQDERAAIIAAGNARVEEIMAAHEGRRRDKAKDEQDKETEERERAEADRLNVMRSAVTEMVRSAASSRAAMKKFLLEPIVTELEGIASRELIKGMASFMNPFAAAKHFAVAGLAIVAARKVAQKAGIAGGGDAGAGGGGGGSSKGTFEPRTSTEGVGGMQLNLYTMNPYGVENIQRVQFELTRGGIMKRPGIDIPPTTGIVVAGGR